MKSLQCILLAAAALLVAGAERLWIMSGFHASDRDGDGGPDVSGGWIPGVRPPPSPCGQ